MGLSAPPAAAEELWVIKDGVINKEALTPAATKSTDQVYLCEGETVDGLYVTDPNFKGRPNWSRFNTAKSAVGDCELKVVFSCAVGRPEWRMPNITITDRARLYFWKPGSPILLSNKRMSVPLENFQTEIQNGPFDGNIHSMAVKRVGDKISCYYDGKKLHQQPIDPDVRLHLWFDALNTHVKIKSIKLTAEKLSDDLSTDFKRSAPIEDIYVGSGVREKPEYGKACRYRIPALAMSKKGTIMAFCEARRTGGADVGDIDAVVKRSADGGKTWGPEILIIDYGTKSVNNHSPVVDPKTGRIWVVGNVSDINPRPVLVSYSDDDGKTWSKAKDIQKELLTPNPNAVLFGAGPGAGIVLERGEHAGRFVIPMNFGFGGTCVSGAVYSDDAGETWKTGGMLRAGALMTEARCVELLDGSLLFNARTTEGKRAHAMVPEGGSKDTTKRWLQADLPDPNCQGAIFRYSWPKDGKPGLILYSGPAAPAARANGTLFGSYDDGKTWPWRQMYYEGPSGYSDACVLHDGRVAVIFEKDGKSNLGFTIVPSPPATPPTK
jgi:sialidase-1